MAQIGEQNYPFTDTKDLSTNTVVTIDNTHHEIHDGMHYTFCDLNTIALASSKYYRIVTPNTSKRIHFSFTVVADGAIEAYLFESPTVTVDGTDVTSLIKNNERNSTNVTSITLFEDPTITADGTPLLITILGSGGKTGGDSRSENEFVLKQNTVYAVKVTTLAANIKNVIRLYWYEIVNS